MSKYFFYFLAFALGVVLGVVLCNWSYFELDRKISIAEILTIIVSSGIAVYIGSNIQNAIIRRQSSHELLLDEIKKILTNTEILETWLENKKLPFEECKKYFKKNSIALSFCQKIFVKNSTINSEDFNLIISNFTSLKQDILNISPIAAVINLDDVQTIEFENRYREIRSELFRLLLR